MVGAVPAGACDPSGQCIDASQINGDQQVVFVATAGQTYYFIVDGYSGAFDTFTLSVTCN